MQINSFDAIRNLTPDQVRTLSPEQIQEINMMGWDELGRTGTEGANASYPQYGPWMEDDNTLGLINNVEGKTVLEIGSAKGEGIANLSDRGAKVIGMDISPEQIKLAKTNPRLKKAELIISPMKRDLKRRQFADFLLSLYSIGYTSDMHKSLSYLISI